MPEVNDLIGPPTSMAIRAITPEQFEEMSDDDLLRLIPRAYREFFPGKEGCANGSFYLHDGTAWSFFRGSLLDE